MKGDKHYIKTVEVIPSLYSSKVRVLTTETGKADDEAEFETSDDAWRIATKLMSEGFVRITPDNREGAIAYRVDIKGPKGVRYIDFHAAGGARRGDAAVYAIGAREFLNTFEKKPDAYVITVRTLNRHGVELETPIDVHGTKVMHTLQTLPTEPVRLTVAA